MSSNYELYLSIFHHFWLIYLHFHILDQELRTTLDSEELLYNLDLCILFSCVFDLRCRPTFMNLFDCNYSQIGLAVQNFFLMFDLMYLASLGPAILSSIFCLRLLLDRFWDWSSINALCWKSTLAWFEFWRRKLLFLQFLAVLQDFLIIWAAKLIFWRRSFHNLVPAYFQHSLVYSLSVTAKF